MKTRYGDLAIVVKGARAAIARDGQMPTPKSAPQQYRSKLEADYARYLMALQHVGVVTCWWYEPVRFRLANAVSYRPDFLVQKGRDLAFHEVKGWHKNRRDALTHLKMAAELFPCFDFVRVERGVGQAWVETPI